MDLKSARDYAKGQAAYLGNLHVSIRSALLHKRRLGVDDQKLGQEECTPAKLQPCLPAPRTPSPCVSSGMHSMGCQSDTPQYTDEHAVNEHRWIDR